MSAVYEGVDVIDSRDVIARIKELEAERADLVTEEDALNTSGGPTQAQQEWDESDEGEELAKLKSLANKASRCADWQHGEALIADHYFEEYAEELAEDIGAIQKGAAWPACHIDWKAAADALKQDYTSVEYGDTTYWVRS
jgi:hypothetical protein